MYTAINNQKSFSKGMDAQSLYDSLYGEDELFQSFESELDLKTGKKINDRAQSASKQTSAHFKQPKEQAPKQKKVSINTTTKPTDKTTPPLKAEPNYWDKNKTWLQPVGIGLLSIGLLYC